jgi:hypothetical protein
VIGSYLPPTYAIWKRVRIRFAICTQDTVLINKNHHPVVVGCGSICDYVETMQVAILLLFSLTRNSHTLFLIIEKQKLTVLMLIQPMTAAFAMIFLSLWTVSSSAFTPFNVIRHLHNKARERAHAADCSPHEAQMYLHELLTLQSGCATGKFKGQDWCDLQGETMFGEQMVDIMARLREKAETRSTR